jgi:hypothetical protein
MYTGTLIEDLTRLVSVAEHPGDNKNTDSTPGLEAGVKILLQKDHSGSCSIPIWPAVGRRKECARCLNLYDAFASAQERLLISRTSAYIRVSRRIAARALVDMERAKQDLESHWAECSVQAAPQSVRTMNAKSQAA